jgi:hypothetical protein
VVVFIEGCGIAPIDDDNGNIMIIIMMIVMTIMMIIMMIMIMMSCSRS